jgi:predicted dehydrogenase
VPIALDCVRAGKHVFVEKPLGVSAAQCRELVEAADMARVVGLVGYQARFSDFVAKLKTEVAKIEPFQAIFNLQRGPMGPQYFFPDHYGGIVDTTTHTVHMALYAMGGEPSAVFASVQRGMTKGDQTIEAFTVVIEYDGGKRSVVIPSSMHAVQMPNFVQVVGMKGCLHSPDRKTIKIITHGGFAGLGPSAKPISPETREIVCQPEGANSTVDMLNHFADLVSGAAKEYLGCTLREGMYAIAVTEAMVKSASEGRRIAIQW